MSTFVDIRCEPREPARYRPIMIAAVVEKAAYGVGTFVLLGLARVNPSLGLFALIDVALGVAFLCAFYLTRFEQPAM